MTFVVAAVGVGLSTVVAVAVYRLVSSRDPVERILAAVVVGFAVAAGIAVTAATTGSTRFVAYAAFVVVIIFSVVLVTTRPKRRTSRDRT